MRATAEAPTLDFFVIGAAKAGTTALHSLLDAHPQLYLPEGKELPYFVVAEHDYYDTAAEFFADAFEEREEGQLCGTVTPQYLYGTLLGPEAPERMAGAPPEQAIPRRIREAYPDVRLIAVLRDPVARARSYHRMSRMRGHENRPFDEAVAELLRPDALAESRQRPNVRNSYVALGEYGRLLQGYLDVFPREQLLVLFHDELERDPAAVCERVFAFLGVDPSFRPPGLGQRHNEGADRRRFAWLELTRWQRAAARSRLLKRLWHAVPGGLRRRVINRFDRLVWRLFLWNRVPAEGGAADPDPASDRTLADLREHYREDGDRLRALLGLDPPWARRD
jgi:sulfotransferase family protein